PELVEHFIASVTARDASRNQPSVVVAKQTALRIGMQIEKLAQALDSRDLETLTAMAGRLHTTAGTQNVTEIAEAAGRLECSARDKPAWTDLVELTVNLLELCRSTYSSYLPRTGPDESPRSQAEFRGPSSRSWSQLSPPAIPTASLLELSELT